MDRTRNTTISDQAPDDQRVAGGDLLFDAVLRPHRSLSPGGLVLLMAAVAAAGFFAGLAFWLRESWFVVGFFGLDTLLIYLAYHLNYRSGRLLETVQLSDSELLVRRVSPSGKVEKWSFHPYWVRIELAALGDDDNRLILTSHGRRLAIGAFLTPGERVEFANALRAALGRQRQPASD